MSSSNRLEVAAADPTLQTLVRAVEDATGYLSVKKFDRGFRCDVAITRWLASRAVER
jgi:hypothetical protein